jgi:hypothetical protein
MNPLRLLLPALVVAAAAVAGGGCRKAAESAVAAPVPDAPAAVVPAAVADPRRPVVDGALAAIRGGRVDEAVAALAPLAEEKGNAPALLDARKILGGIHLDQLFSRVPMPGKYEYAVGRTKGDNLHSIASRFRSTVTFLQRVNQLPGSVIHPGDRLVVCPLDFTVEIDLRGKRLTVRRDGKFFSDYALRGMELPMATLPGDAVVADTSGWSGDRRIRQDAPEFSGAEKRLQIAVAEAGSIVLRKVPDSGGAPGPSLYLAASDLGELAAIIRPGTPVRFLTDSLKS